MLLVEQPNLLIIEFGASQSKTNGFLPLEKSLKTWLELIGQNAVLAQKCKFLLDTKL